MKSKLFEELKNLGDERVVIWEKIEGSHNVTTVTSGAANKVLAELVTYYEDYEDAALNFTMELPIITVTLK